MIGPPPLPSARPDAAIVHGAQGNLTAITDPLGHATTFAYDAEGNPTTVTNALGQQTTLTYNAAGQPLSIRDPLNNTTQFEYVLGTSRP